MNSDDKKTFLMKAEAIIQALQNKTKVSDAQVAELWSAIKDSIDEESAKPFFLFFTALKDYFAGSPVGVRLDNLQSSLNQLIFESKKPQ